MNDFSFKLFCKTVMQLLKNISVNKNMKFNEDKKNSKKKKKKKRKMI
jgi:hypothetical protein